MDYTTVNINTLGVKAKTKNEMYRLLTVDAQLYLPPQKECSIYFVRDILSNKKKAFFVDEIKVRSVPHIDDLRVKDLLWFLENKCDSTADYLPDEYESKNVNRQWLCNLSIKKREEHIISKNKMEIRLHPRIAQAINDSKFISTNRGRSHMLIRKEISLVKEDKERDESFNQDIRFEDQSSQLEILKSEVKRLKNELDSKSKDSDINNKNADILHKLYESGYIDEEGNVLD